jgi:haloalkane dehalogenase
VPRLATRFRCIVCDTPGAGDTRWKPDHPFAFRGQAEAYARVVDELHLDELDVLAHDTGATIARELPLIVGKRVRKLVMINTEIPGHRPPWIQTFQRLTALPGSTAVLRMMLRSARFRRSGAGFGGCFVDPLLMEGEFHDQFVAPLIASSERTRGQIRYLRGIDWALVDGLAQRHREIAAETLFIWGEDDPTFPLALAEAMVPQLSRCAGVRVVPRAKLFAHEERPDPVADHALAFLTAAS